MDIILNELSATDVAASVFEAKERMTHLLKTSKSAFEKKGERHLMISAVKAVGSKNKSKMTKHPRVPKIAKVKCLSGLE